jgi:hypothetical protein
MFETEPDLPSSVFTSSSPISTANDTNGAFDGRKGTDFVPKHEAINKSFSSEIWESLDILASPRISPTRQSLARAKEGPNFEHFLRIVFSFK